MYPSQKTTDRLDVYWTDLEKHAWEKFYPKVLALRTLDDVRSLLAAAPPAGSPSSGYYANLAEFLLTRQPVKGAGPDEQSLHANLIDRLKAAVPEEPSSHDATIPAAPG